MDLPETAARALAAVRARARRVRFEIGKACRQERWRLKVRFLPADEPGEAMERQLGLLWSEDLPGLEGLLRRLEAGEDGRPRR